jgi:TolB-like protein/Flp pilus assembly protein TadD
LRQSLSILRRDIGADASLLLHTDDSSVRLEDKQLNVDVILFNELIDSADLEEAVRLYTGGFLETMVHVSESFDVWQAGQHLRLVQQATDTWHKLGTLYLEANEIHRAIDAGRRLVQLEPLSEPAHRLLMSAYHHAGRRTEALQHYKLLEETLSVELGAEPDVDSQRLADAIRDSSQSFSPVARGFSGPQALADRPSIAILPFENMSSDPAGESLADGVTDDIITALSKSSMFFVIARNSTFTYKGTNVDVRRIANDLGAHYVVEGSVRRVGDRIRITAQLIDAALDRHVWAERYDLKSNDVFEVQDNITSMIATTIAPEYLSAEKQRVERKVDRNFNAWDCYVRAYWHLSRFTRTDLEQAEELSRKAIELDPGGAGHHGLLAIILNIVALYGWTNHRERALEEARAAAETAVKLDDRDSRALRALGMVDLYERHTDAAIYNFRRAIDCDPYEAENHALLGNAYGSAGDFDAALTHVEYAITLSPRDAMVHTWYSNLAMSAVAAGRDREAVDWALKTIQQSKQFPGGYRSLAAASALLGELSDARQALATLLELIPDLTVSDLRERLQIADPDHLERYLEGLRIAGLSD